MVLGENIKKIREEKGMTQKELADKCNIIYQTIGKYERNLLKPKLETLNKIANALEVPIFTLLDDEEAMIVGKTIMNDLNEKTNNIISEHDLSYFFNSISNVKNVEFVNNIPVTNINDPFYFKYHNYTYEDLLTFSLDELKQIKKACEKAYNDCLKLKFYEAYLNKEKLKGEEIED